MEYAATARRRAAGEEYMSIPWVKVLHNYGAMEWSGDRRRPYKWLWDVKDLGGLKIYASYSWEKWASLFYANNKKVNSASIKNNLKTDWTIIKRIDGDDFYDSKNTIDLPKNLDEIRPLLP